MNFTPEQLKKAKGAKSAEELLALAKENDVELTENEAQKYFAELHKEGSLSDEELDNVSGGSCYSSGVWGPNGYQKYLIVSAANCCDRCWREGGSGLFVCGNCEYSFSAGSTLYCSARTEDNDPLK